MRVDRTRLGSRWLGLWIAAFAVAEVIGLGLAGGVVQRGHAGGEPSLFGALLTGAFAGAVEGAVVGTVLALALVTVRPALRIGRWIGGTMIGAMVAWAAGSTVPLFFGGADAAPVSEPSLALTMVFAAGLGMVAGVVLAAFQAPALRSIGVSRRAWLLANAAGWAVAMPLAFVAADRPWTTSAALLRGAALVALMGALVGLATGLVVRHVGPRAATA